jgi:N-acetylglucosamine kinase-like BadF-type ATPase
MSDMDSSGWVIAVDGGGSKIAVAAQLVSGHLSGNERLPNDLSNARTWRFEGTGSAHPSTWRQAEQHLRQALTKVFNDLQASGKPLHHLLLALAGAGRHEERSRLHDWGRAFLAPPTDCSVECLGDIEPLIDFLPDSNAANTIAVIIGTGSIVAARDRQGNIVRAGGWGPNLGDECSGAAIGLAGLRAVVRALDGGEATHDSSTLVGKIVAHLSDSAGATDELNRDALATLLIQSASDRTTAAALAACVLKSALESGDVRAQQLLAPQIEAIAWQISQVAKRAFPRTKPQQLVFSGGLAEHHPLLRDAIAQQCKSYELEFSRVVVTEPLLAALRRAIARRTSASST